MGQKLAGKRKNYELNIVTVIYIWMDYCRTGCTYSWDQFVANTSLRSNSLRHTTVLSLHSTELHCTEHRSTALHCTELTDWLHIHSLRWTKHWKSSFYSTRLRRCTALHCTENWLHLFRHVPRKEDSIISAERFPEHSRRYERRAHVRRRDQPALSFHDNIKNKILWLCEMDLIRSVCSVRSDMFSCDGNKELISIGGSSAKIRMIAEHTWQTVCTVREIALQLFSFYWFYSCTTRISLLYLSLRGAGIAQSV
jgi:hypothetical protein